MTDQLDHLLDQIDQLDQQATKGPWTVKDGFAHHIIGKEDYITECEECTGQVMEERDAAFTALARTALPKLSKALRTVLDVCARSEEHTSELQSRFDLVCRLLLEKKNYFTCCI